MAFQTVAVLFTLFVASAIEARHMAKRQARPYPPIDNNYGNDPQCQQGNIAYANTNDCSTFFQCWNGAATQMACNTGQEFDPEISGCAYPKQNPQCQRTNPQSIKQELTNVCGLNPSGNQSEAFLSAHPGLCNAYFSCSPSMIHNPCHICAEGTYFPLGQSTCIRLPNMATPEQYCEPGRRFVAHVDVTRTQIDNICSVYEQGFP